MRFTHDCVLNFGSIQTKIAYFLLIKTCFFFFLSILHLKINLILILTKHIFFKLIFLKIITKSIFSNLFFFFKS